MLAASVKLNFLRYTTTTCSRRCFHNSLLSLSDVSDTSAKKNRHKRAKQLQYTFEERNKLLAELPREKLYPVISSRATVKHIQEVLQQYNDIEHISEPGSEIPELEIRGRIIGLRAAGKNLAFYDVVENEQKIQVVSNAKKLSEIAESEEEVDTNLLRIGDSIAAVGRPWRTKAGELSILCSRNIRLLSPTLLPLPDENASKVIRKHNRVAELKTFKDARKILQARAYIIQLISQYLIENDFLPVQTPQISTQKGGATARPFRTEMSDGTDMFLRVAPELWLKRLVIGGIDRVFEVGNCYRNEGIDATHNPEFTTCEFYAAFFSLQDLIKITQNLLEFVASRFVEKFPEFESNCQVLLPEAHKKTECSSSSWKVIDFTEELKLHLTNFRLEKEYLQTQCKEFDIIFNKEDSVDKLLDRLGAHFIEPKCISPTFVIRHPSVMAPLAKESQGLSHRFELYINGREYVNAYEEENDPEVQLTKLKIQDPSVPDQAFVDASKWGLPPTGGWGMGIDRLVMLLTNSERIGDVLAFGDLMQVQRL